MSCPNLVTGHARAGKMEAAERVIINMKENRHTPHNVVYTSLLCAHAERGDIDSIVKVCLLHVTCMSHAYHMPVT